MNRLLRFSTLHPAQYAPTQFVRYKRTEKLAPGAMRLVNLLSLFSARGKQPRRLKLCREDLVRHNTIRHAYQLHKKQEQETAAWRLKAQYKRIEEACAQLKELDPALFVAAQSAVRTTRFPLELRVPTHTPPAKAWETTFMKQDA